MDVTEFVKKLPTKPRDGMEEWIKENYLKNELGRDYCIFSREDVFIEEMPMAPTMYPEDWERYDEVNKYHHAAECRCTACGERFYTGWYKNHPAKKYGILMFVGDDGANYDGYIPETEFDGPDFTSYTEGNKITCPYCGKGIELVHKSRLRHGRTHQLLVVSLEVVDGYAVLMTWLCSRQMNEAGYFPLSIVPFEALAIEGRSFYRFSQATSDSQGRMRPSDKAEWETREYRGEDLMLRRYYDHPSWNHTKVGASVWDSIPVLDGTTGEKTGLFDYLKYGTDYSKLPFAYLKLWRKYPNVENIIKSNWRGIVDSELYSYAVEENYNNITNYDVDTYSISYREVKPHKMLGIEKEAMRYAYDWDFRTLSEYQLYKTFISDISVSEFDDYIDLLDGLENVVLCTQKAAEGNEHWELDEVTEYLYKQYDRNGIYIDEGIELLDDYRDMLYQTAQGHGIDETQFFPRNLREAHDRLAEMKKSQEQEAYRTAFKNIAKKYRELAFTDGELCIRVAASESELIDEGNTLKHCVKTYGAKHAKESDVIFFVRHYRRPERSYFTLDINMLGNEPKEVQLHGYSNENVYDGRTKKRHTIPKNVRDFCDRWINEILIPWSRKQKQKQTKKNKKKTEAA